MTSHSKKNETKEKLQAPFEIVDGVRLFDWKLTVKYLTTIGKRKFGKHFHFYNEDAQILRNLILYAIRDEERCKERGIDLEKGILLIGPIGCGKTSLMKLMQSLSLREFRYGVKPTREVAYEFQKEGYEIVHRYGKRPHPICFDDLGVESNIKFYGNECNTMAEILLHRYELWMEYRIVTHATTNLNAQELEEMYGNRARSRLREMFNLFSFDGEAEDKRK